MAEATYREIRDAAQAVNLCNAQQDVIRDLWAAVKASQALVGAPSLGFAVALIRRTRHLQPAEPEAPASRGSQG